MKRKKSKIPKPVRVSRRDLLDALESAEYAQAYVSGIQSLLKSILRVK